MDDMPTLETEHVVICGVDGSAAGYEALRQAIRLLPPGGRLVANAVTLEAEAVLADGRARLGGELTRIAVTREAPVGGFTGWRPAMPVTTWSVVK